MIELTDDEIIYTTAENLDGIEKVITMIREPLERAARQKRLLSSITNNLRAFEKMHKAESDRAEIEKVLNDLKKELIILKGPIDRLFNLQDRMIYQDARTRVPILQEKINTLMQLTGV